MRQVRFLGNKAVSEEELHAAISTREGNILSFLTSAGTYKEEAFDRDLLLLTAFYYDRGYINVKLGKPEIELSGDKKYLYITIPIDEGPQYRIGKLDVRGDLVLPKDEYLRRLTVHTGDVFNRSRLGNDINKLNEIYKDRGYAYVNITPLTNIGGDNRAVDLTFEIEQGQKVYFHRINIRGNNKTRDKVIRRELKISEGELYNQTALDASKRRVMALGFFEKVELSTKAWKDPAHPEAADDQIDVNIEVNERPTGTFQIGAGFSSVENFVGQAQVSQNNLFGRGQQLQLQASISSLRQFFTLRFLDPYFFDTPLTFAFTVYNSLLTYPSFNRTSRGGDITFGYLLSDNVRIFGTYKLETVRVAQNTLGQTLGGFGGFAQASPGTLSNLFRSGLISSVRFSINWDRRNDRLFPTKGVFISGSAEAADSVIGSQAVFSRLSGFARFYYPIWGPFIFRHNTEIGYITSRSNQGVPIYERYFLGGVNTVRGYTLFSLGPRVNILQNQEPTAYLQPFNIGGNLQLIFNTEIGVPHRAAGSDQGRGVLRRRQRLQHRGPLVRARRQQQHSRPSEPVHKRGRHPAQLADLGPALASAGTHPSARCASSGASLYVGCRASDPSCLNLPSATSSKKRRRRRTAISEGTGCHGVFCGRGWRGLPDPVQDPLHSKERAPA